MRWGALFECGPDGADVQVCRELARRVAPSIELTPVALDNKPKLLRECGIWARKLLDTGCERVLIVWDLYPAWRDDGMKPDCVVDRQVIEANLRSSGVTLAAVRLLCIAEELEAWLIADGRALSAVLSTPAHPCKIGHQKRPEQIKNPKAALQRLFNQHRGSGFKYVDRVHALQIVRALPDLGKLQRIPSFARFQAKLTMP